MTNQAPTTPTDVKLIKTSLYLLAEHNFSLDELTLKLARRGVKTNKSALVRAAIDLLVEQELERLIRRLAK